MCRLTSATVVIGPPRPCFILPILGTLRVPMHLNAFLLVRSLPAPWVRIGRFINRPRPRAIRCAPRTASRLADSPVGRWCSRFPSSLARSLTRRPPSRLPRRRPAGPWRSADRVWTTRTINRRPRGIWNWSVTPRIRCFTLISAGCYGRRSRTPFFRAMSCCTSASVSARSKTARSSRWPT